MTTQRDTSNWKQTPDGIAIPPPSPDDVLYEAEDGVARIILNRPLVLNAINRNVTRLLDAALDRAEGDDDVRAVIVTGAGRGIGRGVAKLLAEEGAAVVVNDLGGSVDGSESSATPADLVVGEIKEDGGQAVASYDSVSEFASAARIVRTAIEEFGRLDILVNAAGILRDRMIFNMSEEEWDSVINVHLHGSFNMVRHSVPHMIDQRYGRIVLFSSISALGPPGQTNYSAAKEGIVGLARSAASELQEHGITVNAVYPGGRTRMVESIPESAVEWLREQAANRPGSYPVADLVASPEPDEALVPESNAPKIAYLCTDAAADITGQVIGTHGWGTALFSPRRPVRAIHKDGAWTLNELERLVPISLTSGLQNPSPSDDG